MMRSAAWAALLSCGGALNVNLPLPPKHLWPHARGPVPGQYGTSHTVLPANLPAALAWRWHHPAGRYHTTVAGGPVIDSAWNLYLTTNDGIRKFSPAGDVLWHYSPPGDTNNEPVLLDDIVFGNTNNGFAFALDMNTGMPLWVKRPSLNLGSDVGYPSAYAGLYVMGVDLGHDKRSQGGNTRVIALNATTGDQVWEFHPSSPVWNLMPLFPGDGSTVFMDFTGGVYKLSLDSGSLLWHTPAPQSNGSFTDGGVILGPNGNAYSCSNPGSFKGAEGTKGALRAFSLEDGQMLWEQVLPHPCNSWPVVGRVSKSTELSVVVTPGSFMGAQTMHGGVMAFDAATGEPQWQYQAPVYRAPFNMAKGDAEGFADRSKFDPSHGICLPAHWSAPTIAGDGKVYIGRSDGFLYTVRGPSNLDGAIAFARTNLDSDIDFKTTEGVKVETFDGDGASLHGAMAIAPHMAAFSTCDTLYVFRF